MQLSENTKVMHIYLHYIVFALLLIFASGLDLSFCFKFMQHIILHDLSADEASLEVCVYSTSSLHRTTNMCKAEHSFKARSIAGLALF